MLSCHALLRSPIVYRLKCVVPANELLPFNPGPESATALPHVSPERYEELIREHELRMIQELPDNGLGAEAADAYVARNALTSTPPDERRRELPMLRGIDARKRAALAVAGIEHGLAAGLEAGWQGGKVALGGLGVMDSKAHSTRRLASTSGQTDSAAATGTRRTQTVQARDLDGTQYLNIGTQGLIFR